MTREVAYLDIDTVHVIAISPHVQSKCVGGVWVGVGVCFTHDFTLYDVVVTTAVATTAVTATAIVTAAVVAGITAASSQRHDSAISTSVKPQLQLTREEQGRH